MRLGWGLAALAGAMVWASPASAQPFMPFFAMPERVYFMDTATKGGTAQVPSISVFVTVDPPMGRFAARSMTFTVDCAANQFTLADIVSYSAALETLKSAPTPSAPSPVAGAFVPARDYLCAGKIPANASTYANRAEAHAAGLQIIQANREDPQRQ